MASQRLAAAALPTAANDANAVSATKSFILVRKRWLLVITNQRQKILIVRFLLLVGGEADRYKIAELEQQMSGKCIFYLLISPL